MENKKNRLVHNFIIWTFVSLYALTSLISTIHVISFFELSNPRWMAISLAVAFEVGAAASLASLIVLEKMNKTLIWALFIAITAMQMQGNMYYAFRNIEDFTTWAQLFDILEWEPLAQKRLMAGISGAILPLIALGFIKSLVDYIKPEVEDAANEHMHKEDIQEEEELLQELDVDIEDASKFLDMAEEQEPIDLDEDFGDVEKVEEATDLNPEPPQSNTGIKYDEADGPIKQVSIHGNQSPHDPKQYSNLTKIGPDWIQEQ